MEVESTLPASAKKATPVTGNFENSDNEQMDRWVTVFGFPASHSSIILSYFHNFGQILRVKHPENGGNWIHLHYQSRLQAEKALGKNGKILDAGNIMIGVIRCTDPSVAADIVVAPTPSKFHATDSYHTSVPYVLYPFQTLCNNVHKNFY
jgi:hypothetical protein